MSYKYLSFFDFKVFSDCQSLALHVVLRIRRVFHSAGAEQSALLEPPKKKNKIKKKSTETAKQNKTDLTLIQVPTVLGIQLLQAVECK